jgi:hypothetical protein
MVELKKPLSWTTVRTSSIRLNCENTGGLRSVSKEPTKQKKSVFLMAETVKKPTSNRSAKKRRNTLFRVLDGVLSLSHKKIHAEGNSDKAKQGWARVLVSAVSAYGGILKDEELELRVIDLEEKLKNSVLIPKPEEPKKR